MSGSVSMVPQSMPFDFAHENMLLDDLSGQPLEPDFFSKVLSLPMASSTPCPPDVHAYPFAPPMQSAQTFFFAMSSLYRLVLLEP